MPRYTPTEDDGGKLALYFGCAGRTSGGHFLRSRTRSTLDPQDNYVGFPWSIVNLDTGLLNNRGVIDAPDGRVYWTCGGSPLWYAFTWWDRSGDPRGASNSGFYVRGFGFRQSVEAFTYACAAWPEIIARQHHPLVLQP